MEGDEKVETTTPEMPVFANFDEMLKFAESQGKKVKGSGKKNAPTVTKKSSGKSRSPKKAADVDPSTSMEIERAATTFQTIHFYVRPGDTFESVLKDAREERGFRNDNVRVFAHAHYYTSTCADSCREVG